MNRSLFRFWNGENRGCDPAGAVGSCRPATQTRPPPCDTSLSEVTQAARPADHALVLPVTATETPAPLFRLPVEPAPDNGLRELSFVTVDKAMSIRIEKLGPRSAAWTTRT